jgi:hypothetical protein
MASRQQPARRQRSDDQRRLRARDRPHDIGECRHWFVETLQPTNSAELAG